MILSGALAVLIMPIMSVQAEEFTSAKVEKAIDFIQSKGFNIGEVLDYSINDGVIDFRVCYTDDFESIIRYSELANGDVEMTIIEPNATDTITFKTSGDVFFNGAYDAVFTNASRSGTNTGYNSRGYASYFYSSLPAGVNPGNFGPASTTGFLTLAIGGEIASQTIYALASRFASHFCLTPAFSPKFSKAAQSIISIAVAYGISSNYLTYTTTTQTDNTQAPNVITYVHTAHLYLLGVPYDSDPYYEQKYLL